MWFWKRRQEREKARKEKEAEINEIKADSLKRTTRAAAKLEMLNNLIKENPDDVALRFFAATGGDKRIGK